MGLGHRRFIDPSFVALFVWLIGFLMAGLSGIELLSALRCGGEPVSISCAALGAKGPTGSHYIMLTGFTPKFDGYVYWADEQNSQWMSVQIPLLDGTTAQPPVVANLYYVRDEAALRESLSRPELSGTLTQHGLEGELAAAIAHYNPGVNPSDCWLLEVGGKPHSRALLGGLFAGGLLLHTLAIFLFARPRPADYQLSAMAVASMSPLLVVVSGLHELARRLPLSRRMWGALLFPPSIVLAVYGGLLFGQAAQAGTETGFGSEFIAIGSLLFGVSFTLLALSFLLIEPHADETVDAAIIRPSPPVA